MTYNLHSCGVSSSNSVACPPCEPSLRSSSRAQAKQLGSPHEARSVPNVRQRSRSAVRILPASSNNVFMRQRQQSLQRAFSVHCVCETRSEPAGQAQRLPDRLSGLLRLPILANRIGETYWRTLLANLIGESRAKGCKECVNPPTG